VKARRQWSDFVAASAVQPPLFDPDQMAAAQPKRRRAGTVKKPVIPERDIQRVILQALALHPLVERIERINVMAGRLLGKDGVSASRFMRSCRKGRVDLDGFTTDGRVIAIEVKRPETRNKLTPEQQEYLDQVRRAGGLAGVATCYDEAAAIVEGMA
jgi:hypothetical protein